MRNVTVEFADGTKHVYQGVPDDVTPEDVIARVQKDFSGKQVVHLDGGRSPQEQLSMKQPIQASSQPESDTSLFDQALSGAAGVGASLLDTAGNITSGFGAFENPVSQTLHEKAQAAEQAAKDIGGETAFNVGEATGTGLSFGTGFGAATSLIGKAPQIINYLEKGGKIKRTFGRYLKEAGKSPAKNIGGEAALNAAMAGAGKGTEEATDSKLAGFGAELVTGLAGGAALATRQGLKLTQDNFVLGTIANHFRRHPEDLADVEKTKEILIEQGLTPTLAAATNNPIIKGTADHLVKYGTDEIRRAADEAIKASKQTASDVLDTLLHADMNPQLAKASADVVRNEIETTLANAVRSLDKIDNAETREAVSQNFHSLLNRVNEAANEFGSHLYGMVKGDVIVPDKGVKTLKEALSKAVATEAESKTAKKVLISPDVRKYVTAIKAEMGMLGKGPEKPINVAKLAEIRSNILSSIRSMDLNNERAVDVKRLRELVEGIDNALETVPDDSIRSAADFWRQYKTAFTNSEWAAFFKEHAGELKESPARLVAKLFIGPDKIRASEQLKEFLLGDNELSRIAKEQGFDYETVRGLVRDGLLAELRRTTPDVLKVSQAKLENFVARNRELLKFWDIEDEFKQLAKDAGHLRDLRKNMLDADSLALSKYGISGNLQKLRTDVEEGHWKQVYKILQQKNPAAAEAYRRTLFRAIATRDSSGRFVPSDKLVSLVNTYGRQFLDEKTYPKVVKIVNMIASPPENAKIFDKFVNYFSHPNLEQAVKSVILDRLRRLIVRFINLGLTTHDMFRNEAAQKKMLEYIFTPEGMDKVLAAAKKDPMTKTFLAAMYAARAGGQAATGESDQTGGLEQLYQQFAQ